MPRPRNDLRPKAVQPDYGKWQEVAVGMPRDQVIGILGKPREDEYQPGNSPHLNYGYIQFPSCPRARTFSFVVVMGEDSKVISKSDPFNGRFSSDGRPSQPEIIIPGEHQVFSHYPRVLDLRWYPVSGEYPVKYVVELGSFPYPVLEGAPPELQFQDHVIESDCNEPYFLTTFGGMGPGRFRVMAHNRIGESKWSDYRPFRFTV